MSPPAPSRSSPLGLFHDLEDACLDPSLALLSGRRLLGEPGGGQEERHDHEGRHAGRRRHPRISEAQATLAGEPGGFSASYLGWFVGLPALVVISWLTPHSAEEDINLFNKY